MVRVDENYIIEVDQYNYTPKVRRISTNKVTKEQYESWETIGYYSSLVSSLQGILKYKVTNSLADGEMSLECAIERVQTCHKEFTDMLERVVDDGK